MNDLPADAGALVEHWRRAAPDREALRYGELSWTWAQLADHPGVAEAAVIGVPDDTLGEVGLAFLIPAAGTGLDEPDVLRHCREHLAAYKCPASLVIADELPRNALGKVDKEKLRAQARVTGSAR